jgi:hypothetical protein
MSFLDTISDANINNEAEVETNLVSPLLELLGYSRDDIRPKYPVVFREGRQGRKPETDFAVFAGPEHSKSTSLLVVEAKHPDESLDSGKDQGESYAANLRAPFLILTNGRDFELWQLQASYESECVFSSPVNDLAGRFDELYGLIWKEAAVRYKSVLRQRSIIEVANDFQSYFDSELRRTVAYEQVVRRRLTPAAADSAKIVPSDQLLDELPSGAIVVASSGYGKTTLANALSRQSAERAKAASNILAFYIVLSDAAATERTILSYAQERLAAHCPQMSMPAFRYLLRSAGGVLLLDGFDRLVPAQRAIFIAELNALRRDYQGLQIFIFSRASSRPDIGLPLLELQAYSDEEQASYAKIVAAQRGDLASVSIGFMPGTLRVICKLPLLLQITLQYWYDHEAFPSDLKALFRSWIDQLLQVQGMAPSQSIMREEVLRLIASKSSHGSLSGGAALRLLQEKGYEPSLLDDLIQTDALRHVGASVELPHEAVGDYLRASQLSQVDPESLIGELAAIELDADSLFPVILATQLERHDLQQVLFRRLAKLDLPTYFDALRYRADVSAEVLAGTNDDFARIYLEDMLYGIEEPLAAFFPEMKRDIIQALIASPAQNIAILGNGSSEWINYCYLPAELNQRIIVGPFANEDRVRGSNLKLLGLRADSGRMLGLKELEEELLDLPQRRALKGGMEWISERLVGRIRYLIKVVGIALDLNGTLATLESALRPHASRFVGWSWGSKIGFSVASVLDDLEQLQRRGDTHLNLWWEEFGAADDLQRDEGKTRALLNVYHKRLQLIYKEVVEQSFATVSGRFGFYTSLPVRWDIALVVPHSYRSWAPMNFRWKPVRAWDDAGADVEFVSELPERFNQFDFPEVQAQLRELGRLTEHSQVWAGGGLVQPFDGHSIFGAYTGETPVLSEVCEYIEDDLKRLFDTAPGGDIPYPERE